MQNLTLRDDGHSIVVTWERPNIDKSCHVMYVIRHFQFKYQNDSVLETHYKLQRVKCTHNLVQVMPIYESTHGLVTTKFITIVPISKKQYNFCLFIIYYSEIYIYTVNFIIYIIYVDSSMNSFCIHIP